MMQTYLAFIIKTKFSSDKILQLKLPQVKFKLCFTNQVYTEQLRTSYILLKVPSVHLNFRNNCF